jgi:hypothetical protein
MTITSTPPTYEPCGQCGAPLGDNQRYCVVCGTNRRHPEDPVARYLANAARRPAPAPARPPASRSDGKWVAVALALLPVAAGIGVMVGNSGGSSSDDKLLAALRDRPAAVGTGSASTAAATSALSSDFGLDKGYVVELGTLPWDTTTKDTAAKAKDAATAKGAKAVGLINPDDYALTPSTGGDYLLYAGEYKTKADAEKALKKLRATFPDAKVVKVGASSSNRASAAGNGKLSSSDAVAQQSHPTAQQKQDGAQIVQEIQANKGKSYVEQQRQLPDTIVVP